MRLPRQSGLQFASLGELLGGHYWREKVFAYPGLGQATIDAGLRGDVPLLMGIVLIQYAVSFCRKYDFQPGLWGYSIDRWSVPMLYNIPPRRCCV
ncbi:ABC transporter [Salmonella enterica subsp. arizonae]|uniref:ABC transporter n=1 Tax=Salmonella enterica subsp. arizonae TaxID=59203 RepID=A0A379SXA5_SALER|nr:ABC transporter [Salmonella enterica subsp. arizonae]